MPIHLSNNNILGKFVPIAPYAPPRLTWCAEVAGIPIETFIADVAKWACTIAHAFHLWSSSHMVPRGVRSTCWLLHGLARIGVRAAKREQGRRILHCRGLDPPTGA